MKGHGNVTGGMTHNRDILVVVAAAVLLVGGELEKFVEGGGTPHTERLFGFREFRSPRGCLGRIVRDDRIDRSVGGIDRIKDLRVCFRRRGVRPRCPIG